jgi:8-oxo-dGTP pyrophosphatase MutT (NUDIX family)
VEEKVDLVDAVGTAKIFGIPRSEVKRRKDEFLTQGLYQPIVIVVVIDHENRILAQVRGKAKAGDGNDQIDLVCGVISAGEKWDTAARREAREEIGVELTDLTMVDQRINGYKRHRTLAVARAQGEPRILDHDEVAHVFPASLKELRDLEQDGAVFVGGFFSDIDLALAQVRT